MTAPINEDVESEIAADQDDGNSSDGSSSTMSFRSKRSKVGSLLDPKEPKFANEGELGKHTMAPIEPILEETIKEEQADEEGKNDEIKYKLHKIRSEHDRFYNKILENEQVAHTVNRMRSISVGSEPITEEVEEDLGDPDASDHHTFRIRRH